MNIEKVDKVTRKYLELTLEEPSLGVAKEILAVARWCQEMAHKNRSLWVLARHAVRMADGGIEIRGSAKDRVRKKWKEGFETGRISYIRRMASLISDFEARRKFEGAAEDVLALEARNYAIRDFLGQFATRYRGDERWKDWLEKYEAELHGQPECDCCGMGCCTCELCWEYRRKPIPCINVSQEGETAI